MVASISATKISPRAWRLLGCMPQLTNIAMSKGQFGVMVPNKTGRSSNLGFTISASNGETTISVVSDTNRDAELIMIEAKPQSSKIRHGRVLRYL